MLRVQLRAEWAGVVGNDVVLEGERSGGVNPPSRLVNDRDGQALARIVMRGKTQDILREIADLIRRVPDWQNQIVPGVFGLQEADGHMNDMLRRLGQRDFVG